MVSEELILSYDETSYLHVTKDYSPGMRPKASLLVCPGLGGDQYGPGRLFYRLSSLILSQYPFIEVLRFDYRGSGLSSGTFDKTSLESMTEDALVVAKLAQAPLLWLGLSTGSIVALCALNKRGRKEPLTAISQGFFTPKSQIDSSHPLVPLLEGRLFIEPLFFEQKETLNYEILLSHPRRLTSIMGSLDKRHTFCTMKLKKLGIEPTLIEGGDHLFQDPLPRAQLFWHILNQLKEQLICLPCV